MAQTKAHKKKRRSQAPIALVYFITMIIFLFVIGMLALYASESLVLSAMMTATATQA